MNFLSRYFKKEDSDYREFLLKKLPRQSVGCEVGVWKGEFSGKMIQIVNPRRLYLVDPWLFQPSFADTWYGGAAAKSQADMDAIYQAVVEKFSALPQVAMIRNRTDQMTTEIQDGELDWCYIDGNHEYEYVLADLLFYSQKVKPGGIICGDDYDRNPQKNFPITRAVQEFLKGSGYQLLWVKEHQFFIRKLES